MSDAIPVDTAPMHGAVRVVLFISGCLLVALGALGLYVLFSLVSAPASEMVFQSDTSRDFVFRGLWGVIGLCFLATGTSLLVAAVRQSMHNVVPGPTLYIMGVTLVIMAMFMLSVGAVLQAALVGIVGMALMWLEYRSAFI